MPKFPAGKIAFGLGCLTLVTVLGATYASIAQRPKQKEAPTGFNTPSFESDKSTSNGLAEPAGDTFALDQTTFELRHSIATGLGPTYNATSCASCHENQGTGGASQITEIRAGHNDSNGNFVNPVVTINGGQNTIPANPNGPGRSIINDRAICPQAQEQVPDTENIRALHAVLNTLGDGFVESVPDEELIAISQWQPTVSHNRIHGQALEVPLFELAATGGTRIGRFGWKDQHGSIISFAADAYVNEMGITNRLRPTDATQVCNTSIGLEDTPDALGLADIDHFALFIRGTQAPPRDETLSETSEAREGHRLFRELQCSVCHMETLVTAPAGTQLITLPLGTTVGGSLTTVPDAIGGTAFHPFGDFLLHDVGTGDGIVLTAGHQETANKLRTAPLWGVRTKSRFMHDLKSFTLEDAIERHHGEAEEASGRFRDLSPEDKQALITFLKSL